MQVWILLFLMFFASGCMDTFSFFHNSPAALSFNNEKDCDIILNDESCLLFKKEIFKVRSVVLVDIVFILDVSRSMESILNKIGVRFSPLIQSISNFDWQMAFTTADHGDHFFSCKNDQWNEQNTDCIQSSDRIIQNEKNQWKEYQGSMPYFGQFMSLQNENQILPDAVLNPSLESLENIFYHTITRHFPAETEDICSFPPFCQQGDNEQPLRVLNSVLLQAHSTHRDFFRDNAGIAVFIVTNEPERAEDPQQATTAQDVLDTFSAVFNTAEREKKLIVYGISTQTEKCLKDQKHQISASADYSKNLSELVRRTGGFNVDICNEDYSDQFSEISDHIHGRIQSLALNYEPVASAGIDIVIVNPERRKVQIPWTGTVFHNHITFRKEVLPGSEVEVKYYYKKD